MNFFNAALIVTVRVFPSVVLALAELNQIRKTQRETLRFFSPRVVLGQISSVAFDLRSV